MDEDKQIWVVEAKHRDKETPFIMGVYDSGQKATAMALFHDDATNSPHSIETFHDDIQKLTYIIIRTEYFEYWLTPIVPDESPRECHPVYRIRNDD
jgi:hypothetical protein